MLFSSNVFIFVFLPTVLAGYQVADSFGRKAVSYWLVACSLFFYAYWNPKYLLLLLASILLNYAASRLIARSTENRAKTATLVATIALNLALLCWFKYFFPLLHFLNAMGWLHHSYGGILLPLGISFFTFTQIAYLVDLAQDEAEPQSFLSYVLFVTFFPHLIAGPIIHHSEMMPQFAAQRQTSLRAEDMAVGVTWFILGLAKKVLIADRFGPVANALYQSPHRFGPQATWVGVLCYAIQLYFDFSGYSDMALGLARMFSIAFPVNFNSPYKAASIIDFWQRWHMTLTRYLNLYLYNPIALGISRRRIRNGLKSNRNAQRTLSGFAQLIALPLIVTMSLAGIWHGAGLQFFLFGIVHAFYLVVNHAWRNFVPDESKLRILFPLPVCIALTFLCVLIGQVFFRAASVQDAWRVLATLLGTHTGATLSGFDSLPVREAFARSAHQAWPQILFTLGIAFVLPNTQEILGQVNYAPRGPHEISRPQNGFITYWMQLLERHLRWKPNAVWTAAMVLLLCAALTLLSSSTSFLYFQF